MEETQPLGDGLEKTTVFTQDLIGNFIDNETNTAAALVRKLETDFDVTIEQTTHAGINIEKENSTTHVLATKGYQSWTVGENHRLRLIKTSVIQCHAGVVVNVNLEQQMPTRSSVTLANRSSQVSNNGDTLTYTNCKNVTITLPRRKMGPASDTNDKTITTNILTSTLTKIDEDSRADVGLSIDPLENWCLADYLLCLLEAICQLYQAVSNEDRRVRTMVLCTDNDEHLFAAGAFIDMYLNRHKTAFGSNINISVVIGELNKAKADVLVNTTSYNLDLNHGSVSKAILQSAGPGIQQECRSKYPNGIGKGEVAVTGGYNIPCKHVYHGALERYTLDSEIAILEEMRTFMRVCLEQATESGHTSIAFPAIGSGNLEYPVELVAAEMYSSIEKYEQENKESTIRDVYFVVYHGNKRAEKEFKKIQDDLKNIAKQSPPASHGCLRWQTEITELTLTGSKENVSRAKHLLQRKIGHLRVYDNVCITQVITDVSNVTYNALVTLQRGFILELRQRDISMSQSNGKLRVSGKLTKVLQATSEIQTQIGEIKKMHTLCIALVDKEDVNLAKFDGQQPNVYIVVNKIMTKVIVFGKSLTEVKQVKDILVKTLKPRKRSIKISDPSPGPVNINESSQQKSMQPNEPVNRERVNSAVEDISCKQSLNLKNSEIVLTNDKNKSNLSTQTSFLQTLTKKPNIESKSKNTDTQQCTITSYNEDNLFAPFYLFDERTKLECRFSFSQKVLIYTGDILKLEGIDAVVCGEDKTGKAVGAVAKKLASLGKDEYTGAKKKAFEDNPGFGDVVITPGGKCGFVWVMHALVPYNQPEVLLSLYENIMEHAIQKKFEVVAMSLMGTGSRFYNANKCAELLFNGYVKVCLKHIDSHLTLHIVNNDKKNTEVVVKTFKDSIDVINKVHISG